MVHAFIIFSIFLNIFSAIQICARETYVNLTCHPTQFLRRLDLSEITNFVARAIQLFAFFLFFLFFLRFRFALEKHM